MIPPFDSSGKRTSRPVSRVSDETLDTALLSLLQSSSLACILMDRSRNIQSWNAGAEALLGWKTEEVLDRPLSHLLADDSGENQLDRITATRADLCLRKKNGESLEVQISSSKLPASSLMKAGFILLLQDITEKKFLEGALLEASEREQRRIGQELHNHLCQHLVGAAFSAKALAGALDRDHSSHAPQLHELARLINDAVTQVRDVSRGLHPVELDAAGLMSALQELANRVAQMTPCSFQCDRHVLVKNTIAALNAYRIAQETVTAALQKSGPKKIEITLSQSGNSICMAISVDGKQESELTANPAGIAAKTLHYRAQAMQGTLSLEFNPDRGTRVTCVFPS